MPDFVSFYYRAIRFVLIFTFLGTSMAGTVETHCYASQLGLPEPGTMVNLSPAYTPAHLMGLTIHPDNALKFDFLIHRGDGNLNQEEKKQEYTKLVKYFLASLTVADKDQWVNLSPYEHNRIITDNFGKTEMGRDLLGQDYLLKQITSSLIYPENGLGKEFWDKVYKKAYEQFGGSTRLTINTFNKVWIIPDQAAVYESGNTGFVLKSHLKVMLEGDYLAMQKNQSSSHLSAKGGSASGGKVMLEEDYVALNKNIVGVGSKPTRIRTGYEPAPTENKIVSQIIKEIILPAIEKEINEGKNFAQLRQIYSGMMLATWYKHALKESLLGKVYADVESHINPTGKTFSFLN